MSPQSLQSNWPVKSKPMDCDRIKKDGWLEHGMLVVKRDDPTLSWDQIHMIDTIGNSLYGERDK